MVPNIKVKNKMEILYTIY